MTNNQFKWVFSEYLYALGVGSDLIDETGRLAKEFHAMISELRTTIQSLEEVSISERTMRIQVMKQEEETLSLLSKTVEFRDKETGKTNFR